MSCPTGKHDLKAINPQVVKDREGNDVEIIGAPPETDEEPAWCGVCGALWNKGPFGLGWAFSHPLNDHDAPTILNIIRKARKEEGPNGSP